MRQERVIATRKVTRQLKAAENAVDQAGIELAQLCATLLSARRQAGLSATVGATEFSKIAATFASWAQVREEMASHHKVLDGIAGVLGTQVRATGDGDDKPPFNPAIEEEDGNVVRIAA